MHIGETGARCNIGQIVTFVFVEMLDLNVRFSRIANEQGIHKVQINFLLLILEPQLGLSIAVTEQNILGDETIF